MSLTSSVRARTLEWPDGEPYEDVQRGTPVDREALYAELVAVAWLG